MANRKWFDQSQPQTLQAAVVLCYFNAALAIITLLLGGTALALILLVEGVAANGVANSQRWGYWLAVVGASVYVLLTLISFVFVAGFASLLNLAFAVILLILLLHQQSRSYQRIWFH